MGKLSIQEIASILVEKNGFLKKDAKEFASVMFALIQERLETDYLVKIRGLGTFKIVNVEPRESVSVQTGERVVINSHSKVTFTPDATMKELVNKPFSQFETVILNDGVEFEDLKDNSNVETLNDEEMSENESLITVDKLPVEDKKKTEETIVEHESIVEEESKELSPRNNQKEVAPPPETDIHSQILSVDKDSMRESDLQTPEQIPPISDTVKSQPVNERLEVPIDESVIEEEKKRLWGWLKVLAVLVFVSLAALGGYYYGIQQQDNATLIVRDTILIDPKDSLSTKEIDTKAKIQVEKLVLDTVSVNVEVPQSPTPANDKTVQEKTEEAAVDPYSQKDERVRLGAYQIIGLEREVTVLSGQTFYSICKAHLGPNMECYVEVYNNLPRNPKIKIGQIIKIPKLKVKKRRK